MRPAAVTEAAARAPAGRRGLAVVVVAGSAQRLRVLARLVEGPDLRVLGTARTAAAAADLVADVRPDVVLVDVSSADLRAGGGLEAVEQIMARTPTPVVAVSDTPGREAAVLAAGAVDVVAPELLPAAVQPSAVRLAGRGEDRSGLLRERLAAAARMPVITHPRGRLRPEPAVPAPEPGPVPAQGPRLVVVGASTGGPAALATLLSALPGGLEVPVLVVQHMAEGFVEGLAGWLGTVGPLPVRVARDGELLQPGTVLLAPAGRNARVRTGLRIALEEPPPGQFHVPGVDVAFTSAAAVCGARAVGVLLTGMGRDGAAGLAALRRAGAATFAQDEASSAVWGMPAAAVALGAVDAPLPLAQIAAALVSLVRGSGRASTRGPAGGRA